MSSRFFYVSNPETGKTISVRANSEDEALQNALSMSNGIRQKEGKPLLNASNLVVSSRMGDARNAMKTQEQRRIERGQSEAQTMNQQIQEGQGVGMLQKALPFIFPASSSVAQDQGEGIGATAKQIGAGILDVAANMAFGPERIGAGVLGAIGKSILGRGLLDIGMQAGIGAGQAAMMGQDPTKAAAVGGGLAGAFRGAGVLRDMSPGAFAKFSSELSGADPRALQAWAKGGEGRKAIIANADEQGFITQKILDDIQNPALINADKPEVIEALRGTIVDIDPVIKKLESMKEKPRDINQALSPRQQAINDQINKIIFSLAPNGETQISGNAARIQRGEELDNLINWGDEKIDKTVAGKVESAVKEARGVYKDLLIDAARPEYKKAMESWAEKINATEKLKKMLGSNEFTREQRAQSIFDNLFNRNKEQRQEILKDFDKVFGSDYTKQLENAWFAKSLGVTKERPKPSLLPMQYTGRSLLAPTIINGGIQQPTPIRSLVPLVTVGYSPMLATQTLRAMDKLGAGRSGGVLSGLSYGSPAAQNILRQNQER